MKIKTLKDTTENRAVIYVRVSTKDQVENFSLTTQEKACRDYCEKFGMKADKIFVEEGESAKTVNRVEFQKALAYCRENKGRVKWLVVYAVSRFARSSHDHLQTRALLGGFGINLRSVTEHFDETSQGKLMESILASFAQFDNDVRAERTVAGMKAANLAGRWTFKAPLGYVNGKGGKGSPSLKLNEQITLAEMEERDAKLEGYEVESVLNFAEHIILNAARLWMEASSDQKERLQKVFFPKGVTFANGSYGTTEMCPFFNLIPKNEAEKNGMATLPGIEPGLPP